MKEKCKENKTKTERNNKGSREGENDGGWEEAIVKV